MPENDIWIGTIAIQNDLVLASRDNRFKKIEEFSLDAWKPHFINISV
jgi:predicted nucleic acid-binding protein